MNTLLTINATELDRDQLEEVDGGLYMPFPRPFPLPFPFPFPEPFPFPVPSPYPYPDR